MTWGVGSHILERFGQAGVAADQITWVEDSFSFIAPDQSPEQVIELFRRFYGPTMNAYQAAENSGKVEQLHAQLVELANAQNRSTDGGTSIAATFLRVTVAL